MLDVPLQLSAPGLTLRRLRQADAPVVLAATQDPEGARYLPWKPVADLAAAEAFIGRIEKASAEGRGHGFALVPSGERAAGGWIGFDHRGSTLVVGYVLARSHWGRGLASQALGVVADWALAQPEIWRVEARCHPENAGSIRVLAKAGFQLEGRLRRAERFPNLGREPQDCLLFARVR
ncbi:MAG TPA: GNAT family N-acetyltransferase [Kiloniellales bacterium]|nr:GNAT family N-acetyltransferase [Kiloniellales bacterium]